MISSRRFSVEYQQDAAAQIAKWGYPVREVSKRLGAARIPSTLENLISRGLSDHVPSSGTLTQLFDPELRR